MQFATVFPGQGSQSIGMLSELAQDFDEIESTFKEASDILSKDLWALTHEGNEVALNQTENTQPIMLAAGIAVWRIWQKQGGCLPIAMAGHSLGEYSALVASGSLGFEDALKLVAKRASLMQQAVPEGKGAMAAILGLEDKVIVDICSKVSKDTIVEAVNFNSPGQVVIAGDSSAVDSAIEKLKEAGAKRAIKLSVSVPSHCSLMKDAAKELAQTLSTIKFSNADIPVIQNVEATHFDDIAKIQDALAKQLFKPVLWVDTINNLEQIYKAETIVEFGPGKILFGLNRRINRALGNFTINDSASLEKALSACNG
ncbi:MAG: ACP S-malonyltransferase [Cocleimonas sp.]